MIELKEFLTKDSFSEKIEQMVLINKISYFEAIIEIAEDCDKSPEELLPYFSNVMLDKVRASAYESGLIDLKIDTLEKFN